MHNLAVAWQVSPRMPDPPSGPRPLVHSGASRVPGKTTVLVVDDDYYVRRLTARMLNELGYEVLEASTADEALSVMSGPTHVELVLTDIAMPGMDGVRLADTIAERHPGCPVLLMSGFAGIIRKLGFQGGAIPILQKPFGSADLAGAINKALEPPTTGHS
jgi:CheY-like chemotaxis protein